MTREPLLTTGQLRAKLDRAESDAETYRVAADQAEADMLACAARLAHLEEATRELLACRSCTPRNSMHLDRLREALDKPLGPEGLRRLREPTEDEEASWPVGARLAYRGAQSQRVDLEWKLAECKRDAKGEFLDAARALWMMLDEIDTAGDIARSDDAEYRRRVLQQIRKRYEFDYVIKPDG